MSDRQLIADLLSALEYHTEQTRPIEFSRVAIEAAREYLRKPEAPQPRQPVQLSEKEIRMLIPPDNGWKYEIGYGEAIEFARAIEAKLREKNT